MSSTTLPDIHPDIRIGEPVRIADGLYRLSLPMRANPGHINAYLLVDDEGLTIVDTGHREDHTRAAWEAVLAGPLAARGVREILLTHAHPDHAGNAQWLAEKTGAVISLPDAEHDAMHRLWRGSIKNSESVTAFFRRWDIPEDQCVNILGMLKFFRYGCPELEAETRTLANGAQFERGGRRWTVVYGYGHTPANASLLSDDGIIICGDQVLPVIYPNISVWWGWCDDPLRLYLDSLLHYRTLPVKLALPSHGQLFDDFAGRIDAIRAFHRRRLGRALDFCRDEARTAYESIEAVVNKPASSPVIALIVGQVLASLAWLESAGLVERVADHPLRFRAKPGADLAALFADLGESLAVDTGDEGESH